MQKVIDIHNFRGYRPGTRARSHAHESKLENEEDWMTETKMPEKAHPDLGRNARPKRQSNRQAVPKAYGELF